MDVKRKVLYISYDGMTDPLGQSQVLPYLLELCKAGYSFTILSFEKKQRFQREASIIRNIIFGTGIDWVPLYFTKQPPVLSKIWDRYRMWRKALQLQRENKYDLIHCRSYLAAEVGLKLKNKFGVPFLFDMRGFWADEKVDNGQWNTKSPFYKKVYKHYKKKERDFLTNADAIVSLTKAAKDHLLQRPDVAAIDVIPCCADLDHFNYHRVSMEEKNELRSKLHIPTDAKVLTYLGSIGGWYMMNEMFNFFRHLIQKDPSYHMLILTKDAPEEVLRAAREVDVSLKNLTVTYAARSQLPVFLSLSHSSIFFIRNTYSKMASSPTKHAELMGMGIPVICNDIGDTGNIIRQTGTGMLVDNFDDQSLDNAVSQVSNLESIFPEQIRKSALDLFDLRNGSKIYLSIYNRILKKPEQQEVS